MSHQLVGSNPNYLKKTIFQLNNLLIYMERALAYIMCVCYYVRLSTQNNGFTLQLHTST